MYKEESDNEHDPNSRYTLAKNEELIGVYGINNHSANLVMFGYIVKVKPDAPVGSCPSVESV